MRLITPYAPGSFLKPCLIVSTFFNSACKETALLFVQALNQEHALAFGGNHAPPSTDWIVIQKHVTKDDAVAFHLKLTEPFCNGASEEEWAAGWEPYLALHAQYCPADFGEYSPPPEEGSHEQ
jgi:hypothetical protein